MKAYELPGKVLSSQQIEVFHLDPSESPVGSNVKSIILTSDRVILVTVYSKSEQEDIDRSEIEEIVAEVES